MSSHRSRSSDTIVPPSGFEIPGWDTCHVHNIDLVVSGHTCIVPGEIWRYGNQIGLESLAYSREGAMTLFESMQGRYWQIDNPRRDSGLPAGVRELEAPVDLSHGH